MILLLASSNHYRHHISATTNNRIVSSNTTTATTMTSSTARRRQIYPPRFCDSFVIGVWNTTANNSSMTRYPTTILFTRVINLHTLHMSWNSHLLGASDIFLLNHPKSIKKQEPTIASFYLFFEGPRVSKYLAKRTRSHYLSWRSQPHNDLTHR